MPDIELKNNVTLAQLQTTAAAFVEAPQPTAFSDINSLYALLQKRGSLTLRDATLIIPEGYEQLFFGAHRLVLINSTIITNSCDLGILCNEFESERSSILSFTHPVAPDGASGASPGQDGSVGRDGREGANVYGFVTNIIRATMPLLVTLSGQQGGRGGKGAPGAAGAEGYAGTDCRAGNFGTGCRRRCQNGGPGGTGKPGGNGGRGGNGGNGGRVTFRLRGAVPHDRFISILSEGGAGGMGGAGGSGGAGGPGGRAGDSACNGCGRTCHPGPAGAAGPGGANGQEGGDGGDGYKVLAAFEWPDVRQFLTEWAGGMPALEEWTMEMRAPALLT